MIHAVVSAHINAPADVVRNLYENPANWAALFPATIRGVHVTDQDAHRAVVQVFHIEGRVINILEFISPARIDLQEFKRRYTAKSTNEFLPEREGMRYKITGDVSLKWPYKLLAPFLKPLVAARMRRFVVMPLKHAAEHSG